MTTKTSNSNTSPNTSNTSKTVDIVDSINEMITSEFLFLSSMNVGRAVEEATRNLKYGFRLRALADAMASAETVKKNAVEANDLMVVAICDMVLDAIPNNMKMGCEWKFVTPAGVVAREEKWKTLCAARDAVLATRASPKMVEIDRATLDAIKESMKKVASAVDHNANEQIRAGRATRAASEQAATRIREIEVKVDTLMAKVDALTAVLAPKPTKAKTAKTARK